MPATLASPRIARKPRGQLWVTRARPHVDRCATAWLLRRFVDPRARFRFVAPGADLPRGGVPFDMPGAEHGHQGAACTFEVVLRKYRLDRDPALQGLARIVHDMDLHRYQLAESAGLDAVLRGLLLAEPSDARVLAKSAPLFDALYAREQAKAQER